MSVNIVWLKRDLRVNDHNALHYAANDGLPIIVLYVVEPDYWNLEDTSARQFTFIKESLKSLAKNLESRQFNLTVRKGSVTEILSNIMKHVAINKLLSHEETGNSWTFKRDIEVKKWARENKVVWKEFKQKPVIRGNLNRDKWQESAIEFFDDNTLSIPSGHSFLPRTTGLELLDCYCGNDNFFANDCQTGGIESAHTVLNSFLESRVKDYLYGISSPLKSVRSSSRLSPYLAHGVLSLKDVMQKAWQISDELGSRNKSGFVSRLFWHSHFIQKFETEPSHEFQAVNKSFDLMRRNEFDQDRFNSWRMGNTGVPFVDACMRMVNHTGWINFRMRAMLTAFSSYHLWLHWQKPASHLAQMFIDYEPGIHYPQIQMQSGVTGINPFRMYNPVKQAEKYDPKNKFVRKWIPELAHVPNTFVQQPWLYPGLKEDIYPKSESPEILVKNSRLKIKEYLATHADPNEKQRVIKTHASRKRTTNKPKTKSNDKLNKSQFSLF